MAQYADPGPDPYPKSSIRIVSLFDTLDTQALFFCKRPQSVTIALYFAMVWVATGTEMTWHQKGNK
jgi:hypothetical protein